MRSTGSTLSRISLSGGAALVALVMASWPALAQDAADFAEKFSAAYGYTGYGVTLGPGRSENGTLTFDGADIAMPDLGVVEPFRLEGPVVFSGVVATPEGGYTARSLTLPDIEVSILGLTVKAAGMLAEDIAVPADPETDVMQVVGLVGSFATGPVSVALEGRTLFGFASSHAGVSRKADAGGDGLIETTSSFDGMTFDLSGVDIPEMQAALSALGMSSGTGSMRQHATWSPASGEMDIDETSLTLDGLGKFSIGLRMQGYTRALIEAAADGRKVLEALSDPKERADAQLALARTMLDGMALSGASLTYEDLGLVGKLIDFAAAAQGISREDVMDGLAVSLPALLLGSGDLAATARAAQASTAFLADPRTMSVAVDFPTPFSFAGLDLEDPEAVPEIPRDMAVTFSANGIGPIPLDLEGIDLDPLLGGIAPGARDDARPSAPPPPGRNPRLDRSQ